MQIIPTIMERDFKEAERKILSLKEVCKWIQIDVTDNEFTDGKTFELELLNTVKNIDNLLWDVHLMVKEPINWLNKTLFVGAVRVIGQVEMMDNRREFVKTAKDMGMEAGLAFDIGTEISDIPEETDVVLIMGRKAGFEARSFEEDIVMNKIDKLDKIRKSKRDNDYNFEIGVDGGIKIEMIRDLKLAGLNIAYSNSVIFNGDPRDNYNYLNNYANT